MGENPFKTLSSREVYQNPWISVREDQVTRPDGKEGRFGIITMKPGSSVLAVTPSLDVFLAREFKYAVQRYTLEVVSGALNEGEEPLAAAKRELEEELGYQANRWVDVGKIDPFTTVIDSPNYMFVALELEETAQNLDAGEVLTLERLPLSDALAMVMSGEITHGASCVLILKAHAILRAEGVL